MESRRPAYSLTELSTLVAQKKVSPTKRVFSYLENHGYGVRETIIGVIAEIAEGRGMFHKSDELRNIPGVWADIYKVRFSEVLWYVKFYIDDGILVWSCKPDDSNW